MLGPIDVRSYSTRLKLQVRRSLSALASKTRVESYKIVQEPSKLANWHLRREIDLKTALRASVILVKLLNCSQAQTCLRASIYRRCSSSKHCSSILAPATYCIVKGLISQCSQCTTIRDGQSCRVEAANVLRMLNHGMSWPPQFGRRNSSLVCGIT